MIKICMNLIPNYENYSISKEGKVTNVKTGRVLKTQYSNSGYNTIQLVNENGKHTFSIQHLLGLVYLPNPEGHKCVDHINRNRLDNRLENLRWVSYSQNIGNRVLKRPNCCGCRGLRKKGKKYYFSRITEGKMYQAQGHRDIRYAVMEHYVWRRLVAKMFL